MAAPQAAREATIANRIKRWLDRQPDCWLLKVHGGAYQRPGVPDFIGCWKGRFFSIEVKRPGGPGPTPIQQRELAKIREAGGLAIVARSLEDVQAALRDWEASW